MPEKSFKDVLGVDFKPNFTIVSVEEDPALHMVDYIQEVFTNHTNENSKYNTHLLLLAYDPELFGCNKDVPNVFIHDYIENELQNLDILYESLVNKKGSSDNNKDILIVDDLCMLLIVGSNRNLKHTVTFLRKLRKYYTKVLVFLNKETISHPEAAAFYNIAEALAVVRASAKPKLYTCDLIKMKSAVGAKVRHELSFFEVSNGQVKISIQKDNINDASSSEELLKNLTTFKLTLEDDEKESKSRLHLPYFDAQKITVQDVSPNDYFDDDDEEEEEP